MNTYKTDADTNRKWVLDPENLNEIIHIVEDGGMVFCPATEEELSKIDREIEKYLVARKRNATKEKAYMPVKIRELVGEQVAYA